MITSAVRSPTRRLRPQAEISAKRESEKAGETVHLPCVSAAFVAEALPLSCVATAFLAEALPLSCVATAFPCGSTEEQAERETEKAALVRRWRAQQAGVGGGGGTGGEIDSRE